MSAGIVLADRLSVVNGDIDSFRVQETDSRELALAVSSSSPALRSSRLTSTT
jgi:hypothetical protein